MTQKQRSIAFTCVLESVSWCIKQSPSVFLSLLSAFFLHAHKQSYIISHPCTHTHTSLVTSLLCIFFFCPTYKKNAASILPTPLYHCHQNNSQEYFHCAEEGKKRAHHHCASKHAAHLPTQMLTVEEGTVLHFGFQSRHSPFAGTLLGTLFEEED